MTKLGQKRKTPKRRTNKWKYFDDLYSEFIRRRAILRSGGCERCGSQRYDIQKEDGKVFPAWRQLDCAHIIGRTTIKVRFDEVNGAGLCGGCHMYLDDHSREKEDWARGFIGELEYDLLLARSRSRTKIDKSAIELYLRDKVETTRKAEDIGGIDEGSYFSN